MDAGALYALWRVCTHLAQGLQSTGKTLDKMEHATSQEMIDQVAKCPSGALSIKKD